MTHATHIAAVEAPVPMARRPEARGRIVCLADDLSGLTETATLAANLGVEGEVSFGAGGAEPSPAPAAQGVIYSNLACRAQAHEQIAGILEGAIDALGGTDAVGHVFLKIDSAGRGPVGSMLQALIDRFAPSAMPVVLTNPATGRAVQAGRLYIEGKPIHLTAFANDPLHPINDSRVAELIRTGLDAPILDAMPNAGTSPAAAVAICDAGTFDDIDRLAERWKSCRVATGAAPFGVALLRHWAGVAGETHSHIAFKPPFHRVLVVAGTRHAALESLIAQFRAMGGHVRCAADNLRADRLPLLIHTPVEAGDPQAVLNDVSEVSAEVFARLQPGALMLVGGETAQATLQKTGINSGQPVGHCVGVAHLLARPKSDQGHLHLYVKPGSYMAADMFGTLFST